MDVGTVVSGYGFVREVFADFQGWRRMARTGDPRIGRWRELVRAHGLDPFMALLYLGVADAPVSISRDDALLESRLNATLLHQTAQSFGVRLDWLLRGDGPIYDLVYLESSLESLVHDLMDWKNAGEDHQLLAFKSSSWELEDSLSQSGVLVLERRVGGGEQSTSLSRPIYSLQRWANDKQRWLAIRAIWAAWHMGFGVRGYRASEKACLALAEGTAFPGPFVAKGPDCWHPDDYVVRPSARAKGQNWVDSIAETHKAHLESLVQEAGGQLREWNARP